MKLFNFLARIIQGDSKESSKRVGFLYTLLVLVSFVVFVYTNADNMGDVLYALLWFCGGLVGLTVGQYAVDRLGNGKSKEDD